MTASTCGCTTRSQKVPSSCRPITERTPPERAARGARPGEARPLLAEPPRGEGRGVEHADPRVVARDASRDVPRAVRRVVVDDEDLDARVGGGERGADAPLD